MAQPIAYYLGESHDYTERLVEAFGEEFSKLNVSDLCRLMEAVSQEHRIASARGFRSLQVWIPLLDCVDGFPTKDAPKLLLAIASHLADRSAQQ